MISDRSCGQNSCRYEMVKRLSKSSAEKCICGLGGRKGMKWRRACCSKGKPIRRTSGTSSPGNPAYQLSGTGKHVGWSLASISGAAPQQSKQILIQIEHLIVPVRVYQHCIPIERDHDWRISKNRAFTPYLIPVWYKTKIYILITIPHLQIRFKIIRNLSFADGLPIRLMIKYIAKVSD